MSSVYKCRTRNEEEIDEKFDETNVVEIAPRGASSQVEDQMQSMDGVSGSDLDPMDGSYSSINVLMYSM